MALGMCQDCGHEMSSSAISCQNCGSTRRPVKRKFRYVRKVSTCTHCKGDGTVFYIKTRQRERHYNSVERGWGKWEQWHTFTSQALRESDIEEEKEIIMRLNPENIQVEFVSVDKYACGQCNGTGQMEQEIQESNDVEI